MNKIKCLECDQLLNIITSQHLFKCCGLTIKEYKEKYSGSETVSNKVKKVRIQNCKNLIGKTKIVKCCKCGNNIETSVVNHWDVICDNCKKPNIYPNQSYLNNEDKVICQICFQSFDQISWRHLNTHKLTLKEYRKQFPDILVTNKKIRENRRKRSIGENNPSKKEDVKKKISKAQKFSAENYLHKYSWIFPEIEKIKNGENGVEVICKKCRKWFKPSDTQLQERIRALVYGSDGQYFYCSKHCKDNCPLYRMNPTTIVNTLNQDSKSLIQYTDEEYDTFRKEVLKRQKEKDGYNYCEICGLTKNLNVHHEKPKKTHPHMILDPDNGIIFCKECHEKFGHSDDCSRAKLANLICKSIHKK